MTHDFQAVPGDEDVPPRRDRGALPRFVMIAVIVAAVGAVALAGWAIAENHSSADNAQQFGTQIQAERRRSSLANCREINRRHDETLHRLDKLIAAAPANRKRIAELTRNNTAILIDALVPKRDCEALADAQVRQKR